MSLAPLIRVKNHPRQPEKFVSVKKANKLVCHGIARYLDSNTIVYYGYKGSNKRLIGADWVDDSPVHPLATQRIAKASSDRRKRESAAPGCHSEAEWLELLAKCGNLCVRCGIHASQTFLRKLTKDHVAPLINGGSDYISNIQPLCRRCNSQKGTREIDFRPGFFARRASTQGPPSR